MKNIGARQFGGTIIEALIALLIMAAGMLALAGLETSLIRNVDVAQQRSEAVRLAQEKMEGYRSFTGIASTTTPAGVMADALNWNAMTSSATPESITSSAAVYSRYWTFGGGVSDPMRPLTVSVGWTDRFGDAQTVVLTSVISKTDPAYIGFLGFPLPQNLNVKRPKNRNLNIPIPAIDLGDGTSAIKFGSANKFVVFDNISAGVVQICTPTGLDSNPTDEAVKTALTGTDRNCVGVTGYIITGNILKGPDVSNSDWNAISGGLGIDYSNITRNAAASASIDCQLYDTKDQTTGQVVSGSKSYLCVIPLVAPAPALPPAEGPYNWSGTIRISGPAAWRTADNKYFVCRYQWVPTDFLTDVNDRNVQPYVKVNKSLDLQNYVIDTTANGSSTGVPTCPASMSVAGVSVGVLHQDCRSASNTNYLAACPLQGNLTYYHLTYNGNGYTGGSVPSDSSSPYLSGATVTVLSAGTLVKSGYSFSGWNTAAGGTGTAYAVGATFQIAADTTLYAQWVAAPVNYTVTYNGNGNTGGAVPTDSNSPYASGATVTTLPNSNGLTRSSYTFNGWNTASNGTGTHYPVGGTFTISANTTLFAEWLSAPIQYTVTYNSNGATSGTAPTDGTSYTSNATVTTRVNTGNLSKTGSVFNGWNTATNGTGTHYDAGGTFTITSNTILYAQWAGKLTAPTPSWAAGANPKVLSWVGISNATGYKVSTCINPNKNSITLCTPSTSSTQSATSVSPTPGSKDTWCYAIVATSTNASYVDSDSSSTYCIYQKNGAYFYLP